MTSNESNNRDNHAKMNADLVEHYLRKHPEFFSHRDDLLNEIRIPHKAGAGNAVSLIERQLAVMRDRNTELRHRLGDLIETARNNDRLFNSSRKLVLSLLDSQTLSQAVDIMYSSFQDDFGVQTTEIILFDQKNISRARNISKPYAQEMLGKYLKARQTIGGGLSEDERRFLFPNTEKRVASAAMAVLAYGDVYGVIAIGNDDPGYYQSGMGTLFLSYTAEVFSRVIRTYLHKDPACVAVANRPLPTAP